MKAISFTTLDTIKRSTVIVLARRAKGRFGGKESFVLGAHLVDADNNDDDAPRKTIEMEDIKAKTPTRNQQKILPCSTPLESIMYQENRLVCRLSLPCLLVSWLDLTV